MDKLLSMSARDGPGQQARKSIGDTDHKSCHVCGSQDQVEKLSRCKGCEAVWYCNKVGKDFENCTEEHVLTVGF